MIEELLERIEVVARSKGVGLWSWLALVTAAAITTNVPDSMTTIFRHTSLSRSLPEQIQIAEFMREIGLRCSVVIGVGQHVRIMQLLIGWQIPRTIDMLSGFRFSMPLDIASHLDVKPARLRDATSAESLAARGKALWNKTHRPYDNQIKNKLAEAHPDLPLFIINHEYGFLLADCGGVAGSKAMGIRTSLAAIACLRVQGAAQSQLFGHIHGLRKAWDNGSWNSVAEPDTEEAFQWLVSDPGCRWLLDTIDELVRQLNSGLNRTACEPARSKL